MEKYLNEFLHSELTLTNFCKVYNLDKKKFNQFLLDNQYVAGVRIGTEVNEYHKAIERYKIVEYSCGEIAKEFEISTCTLASDLKKLNLWDLKNHSSRKKDYNENVFDTIDTEEKAYWLGYIFADGYIYNLHPRKNSNTIDYNFELCVKGDDKNHMQKFANFIGYTKELKITKADKNGHTRCRVCLSSKHLWETLNNYGCTPQKSTTLQFPNLSIFSDSKLVIPFIRGYFDGDGCISFGDKEHTTIDIQLLGTYKFLESILSYLELSESLYPNHGTSEYTFYFRMSNKKARLFCYKIYSDAKIYLDRKYQKFINLCRPFFKKDGILEGKFGESCDANPEITKDN